MAVNFAPNGLVNANVGCHRTIAPGEVWWRRSGRVWWVNGGAANAADNVSHGQDPLKPLKRLTWLITDGASPLQAGDAIVIMQGHAPDANITSGTPAVPGEIISTPLTINKANIAIFGLGASSANPQFRGPTGIGINALFDVSADGFELHNITIWDYAIYNPDSPTANINYAISIDGGNGALIGEVTFLSGTSIGNGVGVPYNVAWSSGKYWRFENCTFTNRFNSARPNTQAPSAAINAGTMRGLQIVGCTFTGGTYGWDVCAINAQGCTDLKVYSSTFTGNGNILCNSSTKGLLSANTFDPDSAVIGTPFTWYKSGLVSYANGGSFPIAGPDFAMTGQPYWVYNVSPNASDSNSGQDEDRPLATLATALSSATTANGDVIIVKSGHSETPACASGASAPVYTVSKNDIKIFGTGNGNNRPSFGMSANAQGNWPTTLFRLTGQGFELHGIRLIEAGGSHVNWIDCVSSTMAEIEGCYFPTGANEQASITLESGAIGYRIVNNSFLVTATAPVTLGQGINVAATSSYYNCCQDNIFDGGSVTRGFGVAAALWGTGTTSGCSCLGNTLRSGAFFQITNTLNWVSGTIADASARIYWVG